ncbi:MAG: transporter, family, benzoate transport protein [Actinomycetota bacterium]|jgi:MFS family permease|nr:transporter, family, benzoate transport protein [Actinomycetota bacterium]
MAESSPTSRGPWPVVLCWVAVALDGFDLVVLGAVIPTLLKTHALGFTPATVTLVATVGLVGLGLGAVVFGPVTDRFGRRKALIASIGLFSLFTLALAFAPSIAVFVAFRFIAGLGLGACLPTALTYMTEYARPGRGGSAVTKMMTGYHVGAVATAFLALVMIKDFGWESMFIIGGVLGLLTLPVMWAKLPESEAYLETQRAGTAPVTHAAVIKGQYLAISIALWVATFMGLLLVYGLNTWLPKIMELAGYSTGAGLGFLLALNLGGVTGLLIAGKVSDARGNKPTVLLWFGLAAVLLSALSIKLESTIAVYIAVFLAGVFVFSAQVLVYALIAHLYPPEIRGTALGMAAGVGRIGAIIGPFLGGALVTAGLAYPWGFYIFSAAALLAAVALAFVPAHAHQAPPLKTGTKVNS